jgi:DNA-binding response OmpR family regulator
VNWASFAGFRAGIPFASWDTDPMMSRGAAPRVRSSHTGVAAGAVRPAVLLVTEDAALATACRGTLEQAGYEVRCASHSGHALLECLSGHRADVLLTELSMPDGSGPALAERLRRYYPQMQAVYFATAGTMLEAGNVLVRPFSRDELLSRVRASLV